jgi:hypothetical protein
MRSYQALDVVGVFERIVCEVIGIEHQVVLLASCAALEDFGGAHVELGNGRGNRRFEGSQLEVCKEIIVEKVAKTDYFAGQL